MPTPEKLRWLAALAACGFPEIDATSFVPPQAFPQFADAAEVVAAARSSAAGWRVGALVPNRKGAARAIAAGAQMLFCIVSASASHSMANTPRTREGKPPPSARAAGGHRGGGGGHGGWDERAASACVGRHSHCLRLLDRG